MQHDRAVTPIGQSLTTTAFVALEYALSVNP